MIESRDINAVVSYEKRVPFLIFLSNIHGFPDSSTNVVSSLGNSGYNKITAGNFTLELILFN